MRFHVSNSHRAAPSRRPAVAPMRIPFMWTVTGVVVLSVFGGVFIAALSSTGRSDSAGQSSPGSSSNTNEYVVDLVGDPNRVRHDGFHTKGIFLKAGETITIDVLSERSSDVDLFLRDPQNDFVASDISYSKNCHVQTTVVSSGFYTIVVDNLGPGSNRCHVSYTIE